MKIGIVSDSHGHDDRLRAAVEALREAGAEVIVHCGDVGSYECLTVLVAADVPCYAVAGNVDRHLKSLTDSAALRGVCFNERVVTVSLGNGRELAVTHGNDESLLRQLLMSGQYAYVCCGHTHRRSDTRWEDTRVINPGALHNCSVHTAAVLDTDTDELRVLTIAPKK